MQLSAVEAIRTALNIEILGEEFFSSVAKQVKDYKAEGIFKRLAAEEKEHIASIQEVLDDMPAVKSDDAGYIESEEVTQYLNAIMSTNIFKDITCDLLIEDLEGEKEAIKIGIEVEKDAILYYSGLLEITTNEKVRTIFLKVLAEERKHLQLLVEELKNLRE